MAGLSRPRRAALVLLGAGGVLVGGWLAGGFGSAPPLYDGLPLNSEPYRYLQPPPGFATTAPPPSAAQTFTSAAPSAGTTQALTTSEEPPQVTVIYSTGAFGIPPGRTVTLSAAPVRPPPTPVPGLLDGNVYQVSAESGGAPVGLAAGQTITVALRGTGRVGSPALDGLVSSGWRPLPTTHVPPSVYAAPTGQVGDFALVVPTGSSPVAGGSGGPVALVVAVSAVVVLLAGAVALIRRRRAV